MEREIKNQREKGNNMKNKVEELANMQTEIKTAKISEIKLNPDNPRTISNKDKEN